MIVRISQKGRNRGQVSIPQSIHSMRVGETWRLDKQAFKIENVRNSCSKFGAAHDRFFSVTTTPTHIVIKRTI